jgi:hypothetical protein
MQHIQVTDTCTHIKQGSQAGPGSVHAVQIGLSAGTNVCAKYIATYVTFHVGVCLRFLITCQAKIKAFLCMALISDLDAQGLDVCQQRPGLLDGRHDRLILHANRPRVCALS